MSSINGDQLVASMMQAAQEVFARRWPDAQDYVESELKKIVETITFIESQVARNLMSDEKARLHIEMQKSAAIVMLTVKGLGILAVEDAINAALDVVRSTVNTALGFVLL